MSEPAAVVLAAGLGTRMRSRRAKVLHELMGKPLVSHVVTAIRAAGIRRVVVVVGHSAEEVRAALAEDEVEFALQEEQLGTGHAVMQARSLLRDHKGPLLVTAGDVPLLRGETLARLLRYHGDEGAAATVLSARLDDPTGYGRIVRDEAGRAVLGIVEHADATEDQRAITEINSGTYCFRGDGFFDALDGIRSDNAQGEYYLTDVLDVLTGRGDAVRALVMDDPQEAFGVNDRVQLAAAEAVVRRRIVEGWQRAGVTIMDPDTVYIDAEATLEPDSTILPFTFIRGRSVVETGARIGPDAEVENSRIGVGASVTRSVVRDSRIGADCVVGPYAYLRPGTVMERESRAGAFVELKEARIGAGSRVPHLSYVGDADIGEDVNIGAGTITCNYDGFDKHETVVEDGAFVGSNSSLVAPVRIGKGAFTGAGSVITRDVAPDALAVGRAQQMERKGWAAARRKKAADAAKDGVASEDKGNK